MGTNYYAVVGQQETICPHFDRPGHIEETRWHIGKSSFGWCFSLHVGSSEEPHIPRTLEAWKDVFARCIRIEDEYGREYTPAEIERVVTERRSPDALEGTERDPEWLRMNHAVPGPNGLARHYIDHYHCVGHGDGTYDLITGVFS